MSEEYYKNNEMYKYLKEHAYISYNKKSNYQFELAVDRAQCIANKYHNLTEQLQEENKQLNNILTESEKWLKEEINKLNEVKLETLEELHRVVRLNTIKESLDKITELKEKYK